MQIRSWLDRQAYPFTSRSFKVPAGEMHYIDEGQGQPIVFVHGTPVWSFLYRDLIKELSKSYRCIAFDHLGFGLSDKPEGFGYRPADHAQNMAALLDHLELDNIILVVHDFGGPIGLSYALDRPEKIARLVILNTWMWSLAENAEARQISQVMSGPIGRFLYKRLNFSARFLIPAVSGEHKIPKAIHQQYINAAPTPAARHAMWVCARELIGSSDWYDSLWQRRQRIAQIPTLLLWGLADRGVKSGVFDLARWQTVFPNAQTQTFPKAGHFVQEEETAGVLAAIQQFLHS